VSRKLIKKGFLIVKDERIAGRQIKIRRREKPKEECDDEIEVSINGRFNGWNHFAGSLFFCTSVETTSL
jgi:hypothetical protein